MSDDFTIRIALTEEDFRDRVAGRIVAVDTSKVRSSRTTQVVEIILSDIGWGRMQAAIDDAKEERRR